MIRAIRRDIAKTIRQIFVFSNYINTLVLSD